MACCSARSIRLRKINIQKATTAANAAVKKAKENGGKTPKATKPTPKIPSPHKVPPCKDCTRR